MYPIYDRSGVDDNYYTDPDPLKMRETLGGGDSVPNAQLGGQAAPAAAPPNEPSDDATKKASVFDRLGPGPTGPTGSAPTRLGLRPASAVVSVFDRLGGGGTRPSGGGGKASAGADAVEKWGHDGFEELYGKVASRRQTGKAARPAPYGGGMRSDRMASSSKKPPASKGDLRSKLSGGKPTVKRGKDLPEKCPW